MKQQPWQRISAVFVLGALCGALLCGLWCEGGDDDPAARAREEHSSTSPDLETLRQDVETLKGKAPSQSHSMIDVDYHFTNLWFAAQAENWPLADFYWKETRSHMRWAVRIIPVRKDNAGREVKLREILEAVENTPLAQLRKAIDDKDVEQFTAAYRFTLESCYSCHKASDKPYLHPQIPQRPATQIVNFDPHAEWPK